MAKENTFYFSHDYNARSDFKIKKLLSRLGLLGYGLYWAIIEDLYSNSNKLDLNYATLAYDLRCDEETIKSILNDFDLFVINDDSFGSNSVQRRLDDRDARRGKATKSVIKRWPNAIDAKNASLRSQRLSIARTKGTHTKNEWENMRSFFGECLKCGSDNDIVKDHVVPIYQGGSDSIENIQPLCRRCNASKGSESINYKLEYFESNAYEMPTSWEIMPTIKVKESKGKEIKIKESKDEDRIPPKKIKSKIPKIEEVINYFKENGFSEAAAKKAFDYYESGNWHDSKGNQVKNWKQKMQGVWFKDENKIQTTSTHPKINPVFDLGMKFSGPMNTFMGRCEGYRINNPGQEPPQEWFDKFNKEHGTDLQPRKILETA